jgi:hypothetical protein
MGRPRDSQAQKMLKTVVKTLAALDGLDPTLDPKWTESMIRHYTRRRGELEQLVALERTTGHRFRQP